MEEHKNTNINNKNEKKNSNDGMILGGSDSNGGPKRSIAERRGFSSNAARINTALFRTTPLTSSLSPLASPSPSPVGRSPRITIPPGISPTALLDSPVMLPNSQAMPSPTTGTLFQLPRFDHHQGSSSSMIILEQRGRVDVPTAIATHSAAAASSFQFKPSHAHVDPIPLPHYSASLNQVSSNYNMNRRNTDGHHVQVQPSVNFSFGTDFQNGHNSEVHVYNDVKMADTIVNDNNVEMPVGHSEEASDESMLPKNAINDDDTEHHPVLEGDQKETSHAAGMLRTSEDGYNWRKYGQKQVKGSEYPRSYYKCTQPNCPVKKKVERSHDGQITEIIYKGAHTHLKPHPSRRASADGMLDMGEANESGVRVDGGLVWRNIQSGVKDTRHSLEWKANGQERTSSTSDVTDLSDPTSTNKAKTLCMVESEGTPELSSTLASHDNDEDGITLPLASLEDDAGDGDSESKRRKKEGHLGESNLPSRAVREPRVVVQIESDVDILDDGYRWRKYGQKVVKGNPNPRSYYKCTSAGCSVRKHVERAAHSIKFVITTYEGKHNHDVPTSRNNNQISSSDGRLPPGGANGQVALTLPGNASILKPETQVQRLASHFDRKPEFGNGFLRSNLVGGFSHEMKFGPSSMTQMKYPSLSNTMPYGSYGLNHDRRAAPQAGSLSSVFPDMSMPLPLNLPSSGNFSLSGINFNLVKPMGPLHQSFNSGQQVKENDSGFLRPKQEQKDDTMYGTCIPPVDHANASLTSSAASPSIYQRVMQNFPA
ncbi:hypothetical protein RIF29_38037 [Crotalaria pallida]|uniref:WRKY domain-containing protein n=1 Tax=Crotalaria pallida TaxID=3830 RepID=A0AAN9DZE5_CROPI